MTIKELEIDRAMVQTPIKIPSDGKVLGAGWNAHESLCVWVLGDWNSINTIDTNIFLLGNDWHLDALEDLIEGSLTYVGTVSDELKVWHIFIDEK